MFSTFQGDKMSVVIGIDEAGRGPAVGPLVVGIVQWNEPSLPEDLKLTDSKKMTPAQRRKTAEFIQKNCHYQTQHIPAYQISTSELPLQHLEARVIVATLKNFPAEIPVYADALGSGHEAENWVRWELPEREFHFSSGADEKYPAVSAASVMAKQERDAALENISSNWGEVGSGYPGDPKTISWLENHFSENKSWPAVVRESWSTVSRVQKNIPLHP